MRVLICAYWVPTIGARCASIKGGEEEEVVEQLTKVMSSEQIQANKEGMIYSDVDWHEFIANPKKYLMDLQREIEQQHPAIIVGPDEPPEEPPPF